MKPLVCKVLLKALISCAVPLVFIGCTSAPPTAVTASIRAPTAAEAGRAAVDLGSSENLFDGILYYRLNNATTDAPQAIHVLKIDLTSPGIAFEVTAGDSSRDLEYRAQTTSAFLTRNHLQAAVNGGYFRSWAGGSRGGEDYYPHAGDPAVVAGLSMHAGAVVSPGERIRPT